MCLGILSFPTGKYVMQALGMILDNQETSSFPSTAENFT